MTRLVIVLLLAFVPAAQAAEVTRWERAAPALALTPAGLLAQDRDVVPALGPRPRVGVFGLVQDPGPDELPTSAGGAALSAGGTLVAALRSPPGDPKGTSTDGVGVEVRELASGRVVSGLSVAACAAQRSPPIEAALDRVVVVAHRGCPGGPGGFPAASAPRVAVHDLRSGALLRTFPAAAPPVALATAAGRVAWIEDGRDLLRPGPPAGLLVVASVATGERLAAVRIDPLPSGLALDRSGRVAVSTDDGLLVGDVGRPLRRVLRGSRTAFPRAFGGGVAFASFVARRPDLWTWTREGGARRHARGLATEPPFALSFAAAPRFAGLDARGDRLAWLEKRCDGGTDLVRASRSAPERRRSLRCPS